MARSEKDQDGGSGSRASRGPVVLRVALGAAAILVVVAALTSGRSAPSPPEAPSAPAAPHSAAPAPSEAASGGRVGPLTRVGAAHVLVAYRGAERAGPNVMRSKDEARSLAETLATRLHAHPDDWNDVVEASSDDGPTKPSHGDMGNFERYAMPEAFSSVAFGLNVGEISGAVETPLGFHVIRRLR